MAKKKNIQLDDNYFVNLIMPYDQRDDEIYPKWAVWCANSDDRYYIDGKDGHFYTHIRTDEEIEIERKRRGINEMSFSFDHKDVNEDDIRSYEEYLHEGSMDERIRDFNPLSFDEWKNQKEESAE